MRIKDQRSKPLIGGVFVVLGVPEKIDGDLRQLDGMVDVPEVERCRHFFCEALGNCGHHVGGLKNMADRDEVRNSEAYASFL